MIEIKQSYILTVTLTLILVIYSLGCISTSNLSPTFTKSSVDFQTTTTSYEHLYLPTNISFTAMLTVINGNVTIAEYKYEATIEFKSQNAVVIQTYRYNLDKPGITGNWHVEKIVIENGTTVKMYIVPPAKWMLVPENQTKEVILRVFSKNPYIVLLHFINGMTPCETCVYNVTLTPQESQELLSTIINVNKLPIIELSGTVTLEDRYLRKASLEGMVDGKLYIFKMEVNRG